MTTYSPRHVCAWCGAARINTANLRRRQWRYFCCVDCYNRYRSAWPICCLGCGQPSPTVQATAFYWCNRDCYEQWLWRVNRPPTHRSRAVHCLTTGQTFHSLTQAACFFGLPITTLRNIFYKRTRLLPRCNRQGDEVLPSLEFVYGCPD